MNELCDSHLRGRQAQLGEANSNARQTQIACFPMNSFPAVLREAELFLSKVHLFLFMSPSGTIEGLPLAPQGQLRVLCSLKSHQSEILTGGGTKGPGSLWRQAGLMKKEGYLEGVLCTNLEFSIPLKLT